jgi:DNA (cytosine-5)-methyltransferase 1
MITSIIPVVDLFAGPGGLSEGFSSYISKDKKSIFKVVASVEMDTFAHKTLELRSFFHEFSRGEVPEAYYKYLRGQIERDTLFEKYSKQSEAAKKRAIKATLGTSDDEMIYRKIQDAINPYKGKDWVLVGGPPCQAYSNIGRARRQANGQGMEKQQQDTRNFLYLEYLKIIEKFKPSVFVMENVPGMLTSVINGSRIFDKIKEDLKHPSRAVGNENGLEYKIYSLVSGLSSVDSPSDFIIHAEDYGIPQARHRVILLGVRSDIDKKPDTLEKLKTNVLLRQVISDLPKLRSSFSKNDDTLLEWKIYLDSIPKQNWFKELNNTKDGTIVRKELVKIIPNIKIHLTTGGRFISGKAKPEYRPLWFFDGRIGGFLNHEARGHIKEDLSRYLFSAVFAQMFGHSPVMRNYPPSLLPKHKNIDQALLNGKFGDRFKVQVAEKPASTMTCHISKDGHYIIHYDPLQCRSLTVREAARVQTFPDNYYFEGPRTAQYHQVGNAVPPLLALQIANVVSKVIHNS